MSSSLFLQQCPAYLVGLFLIVFIHGAPVTVYNSTYNNFMFFYVSDLKIVYYNNYQSSITMPWTREEKYFASLLTRRRNH